MEVVRAAVAVVVEGKVGGVVVVVAVEGVAAVVEGLVGSQVAGVASWEPRLVQQAVMQAMAAMVACVVGEAGVVAEMEAVAPAEEGKAEAEMVKARKVGMVEAAAMEVVGE